MDLPLPRARPGGDAGTERRGLPLDLSHRRPLPHEAQAHQRHLRGHHRPRVEVPLGLRGPGRLGGGGPVAPDGQGQLQIPGVRYRVRLAEGAGPAQEGPDAGPDQTRGQRGQAPRHRDRPRLLPGGLARRDQGGDPGELPLRGPAQARHLRLQSAVRLPGHPAVARVLPAGDHR